MKTHYLVVLNTYTQVDGTIVNYIGVMCPQWKYPKSFANWLLRCPKGLVVDHLDNIPQHNQIQNLEQVTQSVNVRRANARRLQRALAEAS